MQKVNFWMMKCNDLNVRLLACVIAHLFKMAELVCPKSENHIHRHGWDRL